MSIRIARTGLRAAAAGLLLATSAAATAAPSARCVAASNSARAEPDWYLDECLGGIRPRTADRGPGPWLVPGDKFYLHNIRNAGQFPLGVYTAPIPTYNFTLLGSAAPNTIYAVDFDNTATTLWGINNDSRGLGRYDLATGDFTQTVAIVGIPVAETISGLKFDPGSATVYVSTTIALYTLNTATGSATLIGTFTHLPSGIIDIAISTTGQMYGADLNDNFYRIDKATAATTLVGPLGVLINFAQGMDFDASDGTLYLFAYIGGGLNELRRIDTATGQAVLILNGPDGPEHEGAVKVAVPAVAVAPVANAVDSGGDGVFEPNETVTMAPTWRNNGSGPVTLTGALSSFTGPAGATYVIQDGAAAYGLVGPGVAAGCGSNCYALGNATASRPATHWDASVLETVNPGATAKTWTLHIGSSFGDVPPGNPFFKFVETILHKNVTGGCTATTYCPADATTREQMAVFVLVAREPAGFTPPPCGATPMFTDVPASSPFCRWIEELSRRGVVGGCAPGLYCPSSPATREQMAVFVLRTLDPTLNPPACATPMFNDVPAASPFCRWIEELVRRGVVSGCGGGNYCPTSAVTREQMSVFLAVTFGLVLYGV